MKTHSIDVLLGSEETREERTITHSFLTALGGGALTGLNLTTQVSAAVSELVVGTNGWASETKLGVTLLGGSMILGGGLRMGRTLFKRMNRLKT